MKTYRVNTARAAADNSSSSSGGGGGGGSGHSNALSLPPSINLYSDADRSGGGVGSGGLNIAGISMAKKFGKVVRYRTSVVSRKEKLEEKERLI